MSGQDTRLDFLDGFRGLAALWVILGHVSHAVGFHIPLISQPSYAVDLFMIMSGFLMYYHAVLRTKGEPPYHPRAWAVFWTRRFFRIAPAYYVVFAVAMLLEPYAIGWMAGTKTTLPGSYFSDGSWAYIPSHLSFIFGTMPDYHLGSYIPDWSLSLEMQFYAVFPFLFMAMLSLGALPSALAAFVLCFAAWGVAPDYMASFLMPTLLLLKINIFLAGMLIAAAMFGTPRQAALKALAAAMLVVVTMFGEFGVPSAVFRLLMIAAVAILALYAIYPLPEKLSKSLRALSSVMGNRFFHYLSEASYGVYLIHPIVMFPVSAWMLKTGEGRLPLPAIYLGALGLTVAISYALGWILMQAVERPGIRLGKAVAGRLKHGKTAARPL